MTLEEAEYLEEKQELRIDVLRKLFYHNILLSGPGKTKEWLVFAKGIMSEEEYAYYVLTGKFTP